MIIYIEYNIINTIYMVYVCSIYIEYNIINTIYIWYMCVAYSCACAYGRERDGHAQAYRNI